jgi:predicted RNA methylase
VRLAGQAKAGFFPTPELVLEWLCSRLKFNSHADVLDPCCGTGDALVRLAEALGSTAYGIELDSQRAKQASKRCENIELGDALTFKARGFGLLYLNPPYDVERGERLEVRFLKHFHSSLAFRGTLMYVIPEYVLKDSKPYLEQHFNDLAVYRFPPKEYEAYHQVIVVGRRLGGFDEPGVLPDEIQDLFDMPDITVRSSEEPSLERKGVTDALMLEEANSSGLWTDLWQKTEPARTDFQPLMQIMPGHLALLIAGGYLNGQVVEGHGRRLLVNGNTMKTTSTEESEDGVKTVERQNFVGCITALDLERGEVITIQ